MVIIPTVVVIITDAVVMITTAVVIDFHLGGNYHRGGNHYHRGGIDYHRRGNSVKKKLALPPKNHIMLRKKSHVLYGPPYYWACPFVVRKYTRPIMVRLIR